MVLGHLYVYDLPKSLQWIDHMRDIGHFAVVIFIVLSGYCLMMPVATSSDGQLRGGLKRYFTRRALRILPPYYVALAVSVALALYSAKHHGDPVPKMQIISHIFLFHNLSLAWMNTLNHPMWSVPVEWQIYFLMPFVFLPIWRKAGVLPMIATGLILGYLPHFLLPAGKNFDWSCPWFAGMFAVGMMGAVINLSKTDQRQMWLRNLPWSTLGGIFTVAFGVAYQLTPAPSLERQWLDPLCGLAAISVIIGCAQAKIAAPDKPNRLINLFESRFALTLGMFSYSLYLIHWPTLMILQSVCKKWLVDPRMVLAFNWLIAMPIILATAYGFYLLVERRFIDHRSAKLSAKSGTNAPRVQKPAIPIAEDMVISENASAAL